MNEVIRGIEASMKTYLESQVSDLANQTDTLSAEVAELRKAHEALDLCLRTQKSELIGRFERELGSTLAAQAAEQDLSMSRLQSSLAEWKSSMQDQTAEYYRQREKQVQADLMDNLRHQAEENVTPKAGEVMKGIQELLEKQVQADLMDNLRH